MDTKIRDNLIKMDDLQPYDLGNLRIRDHSLNSTVRQTQCPVALVI